MVSILGKGDVFASKPSREPPNIHLAIGGSMKYWSQGEAPSPIDCGVSGSVQFVEVLGAKRENCPFPI